MRLLIAIHPELRRCGAEVRENHRIDAFASKVAIELGLGPESHLRQWGGSFKSFLKPEPKNPPF
jgi:hypothetical protein